MKRFALFVPSDSAVVSRPNRKNGAAIHQEIAREVNQFLGDIFAGRRSSSRGTGLEAVESALRAAQVLEALLSGSTISESAAKADVHRSTVHLWCRQNTVFRAAPRDAESRQATTVFDGLRGLGARALSTSVIS